jgi:hypothetical protein
MSDGEGGLDMRVVDVNSRIQQTNELVNEAAAILHDGRIPLALFLEDCLSSVNPDYLRSVVKPFVLTRFEKEEQDRLYKGLTSPNDERGQERETLEHSDKLFLLHLFDFCTAGKAIQDQANGWHPKLIAKLPFERDSVGHQIEAVRKNRNKVEHRPHTIRTSRDVEFIRIDSLKLFLGNIKAVIDFRPEVFRAETVKAVSDYIYELQNPIRHVEQSATHPDTTSNDVPTEQTPCDGAETVADPAGVVTPKWHQSTWMYGLVAAIGLVAAVAAMQYQERAQPVMSKASAEPVSSPPAPTPTGSLVIIATQKLDSIHRRRFVSLIRDTYYSDTVIRVAVVWGDEQTLERNVNVLNDAELFDLLSSMVDEPMFDITQFTKAFNDGYQLMRRYQQSKQPLNMVVLGHLPVTTEERYRQLVTEKWNPVEKEDLTLNWEKSQFGHLRWFRTGAIRPDEQAFVDKVLCRRTETLRPKEINL